MNRFFLFLIFLSLGFSAKIYSQGHTRQTYHDKEKKHLKEVYQVKDTIRNILHGRYISYYLNGNVESKGQFENNETTGVWEFFYETGNLKMRGILRQNSNFGLWEYFYESGQKSMEGTINGKNRIGEWKTYYENGQMKEIGEYQNNLRVGLWKTYFEDGVLKGEIDYKDDFGRYIEYYHSGKVLAEGPKSGTKPVGHWRYFGEDGVLQSEGDYESGKQDGEWTYYYSNGKVSSKGRYANNEPVGNWEYYFEDGTLSSSGQYIGGTKNGYWKTLSNNGGLKSEVTYHNGSGEYREYYATGKLKVKGTITNEKRQGKWQFFYENGILEGECEYKDGKGTYLGYYANGALQTKGAMEDDRKTGTWEIYETDGKLAGYYRPFYDDRNIGKEIVELAGSSKAETKKSKAKRFTYFDPRFNEFRGVIVGTNPVFLFAGKFPLGIEFYQQERLGHEFEFVGIRDPFFMADENIPPGKQFERGYNISIKQKFYNPMKVGMWYFGHEVRFTNLGHFTNVPAPLNPENVFTVSSVEQRIEWGLLLGYRLMRRNNARGFTLDAFISGDAGYRGFDVDPKYDVYFNHLNTNKFSTTFHFGLNMGNVFSFR